MTQQKSRLGRGLDSLVSVESFSQKLAPSAFQPTPGHSPLPPSFVQFVPVADIQPNPQQPRTYIDPASLDGLVDSLRTTGLLQPVIVRRHNNTFQLIAGERRWRAAQKAGLHAIPAMVREASDKDMLEVALIENLQRADLNPVDRAGAYAAYMAKLALTQEQASHRLGQDRATIANYIRLLDLDKQTRELLASDKISMGHARALLSVGDPAKQRNLAKLIAQKGLSVRRTEALIRELAMQNCGFTPKVEDVARRANLREMEDRLSRRLGRKVRIRTRGAGNKGEIVISYSTLDEFDELITRLCED